MRIKRFAKTGSFRYCNAKSVELKLNRWIDKPISYTDNSFCFLNQKLDIVDGEINWSFNGYGKLWTYNLHYMDYLLQSSMTAQIGQQLIEKYIKGPVSHSPGLDPYPVSLRGINWIKFFSKHKIRNSDYDSFLFNHYCLLYNNLEFHLLANHLIENAFSLLYGSLYFDNAKFFKKARIILEKELKIQVLSDGGHFERSPMYHQIILDRLLDCINLLENNHVFGDEQDSLLFLMKDRAGIMLGWINYMTFESGDIPMVNDSAPAIAPLTRELNEYASRMGLLSQSSVPLPISNLKESGYRRFNGANYECMVDVGEIRPDFQPGHSHAGTFSFVVQYQNKPFIVDTGVSTYEKNARRAEERSTSAHNTVQVQNKNSSQVWGGFRVGRRAKIKLLQEDNFQIVAQHDGYKPVFVHERKFNFQPYKIEISDQDALKGTMILTARIHFHPDVNCKVTGNMVVCDNIKLEFNGHSSLKISEYMFAAQFNQLKPSKMVEIIFDSQLKTTISF